MFYMCIFLWMIHDFSISEKLEFITTLLTLAFMDYFKLPNSQMKTSGV